MLCHLVIREDRDCVTKGQPFCTLSANIYIEVGAGVQLSYWKYGKPYAFGNETIESARIPILHWFIHVSLGLQLSSSPDRIIPWYDLSKNLSDIKGYNRYSCLLN